MERRKTRNQIRRERIKRILCAVATVLMWVAVAAMMINAWANEPTISEAEHRAYIESLCQTNSPAPSEEAPEPAQEPAPAEKAEETPSVALYDVPLDAELQLQIIEQAEAHGIDPAIIMAMAYRESSYNAAAIGDNGNSFGLLQVQPYWHSDRMERLGCTDLLDPFQNVTVAVDYLAECLGRYDGDIAKALVAYNQGSFYETITDYALSVLGKAEELRGETELQDLLRS